MHSPGTASLEVNLTALTENYRLLVARHARKNAAAVVKANAYGLGMVEVSKALWNEGCRTFFVAHLSEGIELRAVLPDADIAVFNGLLAGEAPEYAQHRLIPVLNDPAQIDHYKAAAGLLPPILHVDTGMTRLGFSHSELETYKDKLPKLGMVMSHLACANEPKHPKNAEQLARFQAARALLPGVPASLSNSSGLFLDAEYHFDLARPGCAIYGITPVLGENPMQHVATLCAPIIQLRRLDRDESVGYGSTYPAPKQGMIAVTALGYADGYLRYFSNKGFAYFAGYKVPIAGRVSMDMISLDVSAVPEHLLIPGTRAEFINKQHDVNALADDTTIGYEIFTRIGRRVKRLYTPL